MLFAEHSWIILIRKTTEKGRGQEKNGTENSCETMKLFGGFFYVNNLSFSINISRSGFIRFEHVKGREEQIFILFIKADNEREWGVGTRGKRHWKPKTDELLNGSNGATQRSIQIF